MSQPDSLLKQTKLRLIQELQSINESLFKDDKNTKQDISMLMAITAAMEGVALWDGTIQPKVNSIKVKHINGQPSHLEIPKYFKRTSERFISNA